MLEVAGEEGDAAQFADVNRPQEAIWPVWSGTIRDAWFALRSDRFYGSMGGLGPIYYTAISQYARDHDIALHPFADFIAAMDEEFVAVQHAKAQKPEEPTEDQ